MSPKFQIGDRVRILGCTQPCEWMFYNNDENTEDVGNMDDCIGRIGYISEVFERGFNRYSYTVSGCGEWQWVDWWIEFAEDDTDQIPGQISIEEFGLVVDC